MTGTFDTLTAARQLEAAGMDRDHAEAIAAVVRAGHGELATKDDITALRNDLGNKIDALAKQMDTLRWLVGLNFAMTMAVLAVVLAHAL